MLHLDLALFFRSEELHDGRLDDGYKRHVGIGRHRDCTEEFRREFSSQEDGGGTIRTTYDGDGARILDGEADRIHRSGEPESPDQGGEDSKLRGGAKQGGLGVGQERPEVGHGAHPHENEQREHPRINAEIEDHVEEPALLGHPAVGNVREDSAEPDRDEQKRFKLLGNAEVDQEKAHDHHHEHQEPGEAIGEITVQSGTFP